jgi:hypothetical protein
LAIFILESSGTVQRKGKRRKEKEGSHKAELLHPCNAKGGVEEI